MDIKDIRLTKEEFINILGEGTFGEGVHVGADTATDKAIKVIVGELKKCYEMHGEVFLWNPQYVSEIIEALKELVKK